MTIDRKQNPNQLLTLTYFTYMQASHVQCKWAPVWCRSKVISSTRSYSSGAFGHICWRQVAVRTGGGGGDYLHFARRQIHILSAQLWDTFQCSDVQVRQRQLISFCLLNTNTRDSRIFDVKAGTFQIKTRIFGHCKSKGPHASGSNPSEIHIYKLFIIVWPFGCWSISGQSCSTTMN